VVTTNDLAIHYAEAPLFLLRLRWRAVIFLSMIGCYRRGIPPTLGCISLGLSIDA
jgi:hypothetical protein